MKPVAVFQHTRIGAPGTIVPILESLGCEVRLVRIVDGDAVPPDASAFSGIVFMGGYMGVHDDLPWIPREIALIRDADARGLPLVGHCLGSQLIALALGGEVVRHTMPEIGWRTLQTDDSSTARDWWGEFAAGELQTFQWHGDTFVPPSGAVRIARGIHCANQAFVLGGRHLLMQSHLEMTPALIALSIEQSGHQLQKQFQAGNPAVSDPADVLNDLESRTADMRVILERLYARWIQGLGW